MNAGMSNITHRSTRSFAGRRHGVVLSDDSTLRDDPMVSRGRVDAADPFAGRDRRRFRSAQCDTRFRIQSGPRPVGKSRVPPPALPDSASDPAGTSSLRTARRGDPGVRNLGGTFQSTAEERLLLFLPEGKGKPPFVHNAEVLLPRGILFPRATMKRAYARGAYLVRFRCAVRT